MTPTKETWKPYEYSHAVIDHDPALVRRGGWSKHSEVARMAWHVVAVGEHHDCDIDLMRRIAGLLNQNVEAK